jgi:hypothetical protein
MIAKVQQLFIFSACISSFVFQSCLKPESYPDEPEIAYKDFKILGDSAILSIDFVDGDGDIGLNPEDIQSPYDAGSFYHYNLYLEYFEMMEGQWVKGTTDPAGDNFPTGDTLNFSFRIKNITPTGQNKTLKGIINVTLEPVFYNILSNHNDTIKFRVSLIDRALNVSNFIETPAIVR